MEKLSCKDCHKDKSLDEFYKGQTKCKECVLKRKRERYQSERDHMLAINKKWYDEKGREKRKQEYRDNKEKYALRWKLYYDENKERLNEKSKQHYHDNKKHYSDKHKEHYYNNYEWHLKRLKDYRESPQGQKIRKDYRQSEQGKQSNKRYKHKRRSKERESLATFTLEQWGNSLIHFENKCCYCGEEKELTQDHFVPVFQGGEYTVGNIVPSCGPCNFSKRDRPFNEWYPKQDFYLVERENKILKYLNYEDNKQQMVLF